MSWKILVVILAILGLVVIIAGPEKVFEKMSQRNEGAQIELREAEREKRENDDRAKELKQKNEELEKKIQELENSSGNK